MVKRLLNGNLFCCQDPFFYKEVSHMLILVHQEKHSLKSANLHNQLEKRNSYNLYSFYDNAYTGFFVFI